MFNKIRSFLGRKAETPAAASHGPSPATSHATQSRQASTRPAAPPALATSRLQESPVASRSRSGAVIGRPDTSPAAQRTATSAALAQSRPSPASASPAASRPSPAVSPMAAPAATDHRRVQKSYKKGERVKADEFMSIATADGSRDLRTAKTREVLLKTRQGDADGLTMRHRSGSVTELHLAADSSQVTSAKHYSKTTGKISEVRESHMRGPAQKQLTRTAKRKDHRDL